MLEQLLPLKLPPGLYRNGTKYQAKGRWYTANLVRFYEDAIRPVQGWRVALGGDTNDPIPALEGTPRAALAWRSATGVALLAVGTNEKLYIIKDGVTYDITPEDFDAGDADAGGATNGCYGNGRYGVGLYGEGKSPLAATLEEADTWQLDAFGDVLVACCTKGGRIYVWTGDTAEVAVVAGGDSPEPNRGVVITPERFIVALGANDDVRLVAWASQATLDDWDPTDENTAGDFTLPTNGRIMCGRRTKAQTLIWTDADVQSMNYIGGSFVYSFKQEGDNCGIVSPNAVAIVDTAAIWMGRDNFFLYDGFVKPVPCEVHDYVFDSFNAQQASKVFACAISEFSEIWWFYPSAGSVENDRYVVYNYRENHWTTGHLGRTAAVDRGALPNPVGFDALGNVYEHEIGAGAHETPIPTMIADSLIDANDVDLAAHTPGGSPATFSWEKIIGSGLKFQANRLVNGTPTVGTTLDSFQGTGPTYLENHTSDIGATYLLLDGTAADSFFSINGNALKIADDSDFPSIYVFDHALPDAHTPVLLAGSFNPASTNGIDNKLALRFTASRTTLEGRELRVWVNPLNLTQMKVELWRTNAAGVATQVAATVNVTIAPAGFVIGAVVDVAGAVTGYVDGVAVITGTDVTTAMTSYCGLGYYGAATPPPSWSFSRLSSGDSTQPGLYLADEALSSDDHMVSVVAPAPTAGSFRGVVARASGTGAEGYYFGVHDGVAKLFGLDAGGSDIFTQVTAAVDPALLDGDVTPSLKVEGTSLKGYINGVLACSTTDATYTTGRVGLYGGGADDAEFKGPFTVLSTEQAADPEVVEAVAAGATTVVLTPYLESGPMELDHGDRVVRVQCVVPDEKNLGDVQMRFFGTMFPTEAETEHGPYSSSNPTSVRFTARQLRLRIEQAVDTNWRLGTTRVGVIPGGRR